MKYLQSYSAFFSCVPLWEVCVYLICTVVGGMRLVDRDHENTFMFWFLLMVINMSKMNVA